MAVSLPTLSPSTTKLIALVGNPNTGKTTLFNVLTGHRQRVGNYPGVTVEKKTGRMRTGDFGREVIVMDLPGTYSLAARSADEAVVLDVLMGHQSKADRPDLLVTVVDASNLARNLFFATQVLELGQPVVIALNMMDAAADAGLRIDSQALARELGVPVVSMVASKKRGIDELRQAIHEALESVPSHKCPDFPQCVCAEIDGLCESVEPAHHNCDRRASRVELLQTLLDPGGYHEEQLIRRCGRSLADELAQRRTRIQAAGESIAEVEAKVRYDWIERVAKAVITRTRPQRRSSSERADRVFTHPFWGMLILLFLSALCFQAIYTWTSPLMDAVDGFFSALGRFVGGMFSAGALRSLVADGILAGVGAVLTFLPQILILFLFIAILESCGYMARAAFLLDRWMGFFGLSGKSFIPLLSSFACAVPGIMAARTIEDRRDRLVTILIAPLMSCSARLPVYALLIACFIPAVPLLGGWLNLQAITLLAMCCIGALVAIPVAYVLKRTILRGPAQPFLMELPPYRWPTFSVVLHRIYAQGRAFCVDAGTIIFAMSIVIWALSYYPRPAALAAKYEAQRAELTGGDNLAEVETGVQERLDEIGREEAGAYLRQSFLGRMGTAVEPLVSPLGWDWRMGTAAIASFPAREVVIATMGTIYNMGSDQDGSFTGLREKLKSATRQDGSPSYNAAVALSLMVFFALCCQCGGTLATIKRETNSWGWPVFTFVYMTALAYAGALITYQTAVRLI